MDGGGPGAPGPWLRAGRVGRPHGLDGSFHVLQAASLLLTLGAEVRLGAGGEGRRIERRAGHDARLILRLDGCTSRDGADALRGVELFVARATAPALEDEEWWAEELEGCTVHDGGREVGVVVRLLGLPSCEVLEVRRSTGPADRGDGPDAGAEPLLVPLVGDAVRTVDVAARRIDIDLAFLGEL